jgi:hypothetical protein
MITTPPTTSKSVLAGFGIDRESMRIQCDKAKLRVEPLSAMPYLARLITAPRRFTQGTSPHVNASEQIIIQDHTDFAWNSIITDFRGKLRSVYARAGDR